MIALLAAAAFSFGTCSDALCGGDTLAPVMAKLAGARAGRGRPVHILQIGDSHTAGDTITGAWRDTLQGRFGIGGRGVLPPGRPYDGYITHGVTVSMSTGWRIAADFGKGWSDPHPPLGLSAFSLTSEAEGASMSLVADPQEAFNRLVVCAIAKAGAGALTIRIGGQDEQMDLGSITERPQCRTMRSDQPQATASLTAQGGPVTVTSWATFADGKGGVALSNLGVVGSQLIHFSRTDDAVLAEELRAYAPDMIVLAFGTNEGFAGRFSAFEYEIILRTQIGRIRRLAGNVPILLLGAPDALTRRADLLANAGGAPSVTCPDVTLPVVAAAPPAAPQPSNALAGAMARLGYAFGIGDDPAAAPAAQPPAPAPAVKGGLFPPQALAEVRAIQRRVAASLNVAYWDWEARMGGRCTARAWVRATPPLMRGDYVHYTSAGGHEIAERLQADLDKVGKR